MNESILNKFNYADDDDWSIVRKSYKQKNISNKQIKEKHTTSNQNCINLLFHF